MTSTPRRAPNEQRTETERVMRQVAFVQVKLAGIVSLIRERGAFLSSEIADDLDGLSDALGGFRKAAERLMVSNSLALPKNAEIESALLEHQRLFQSNDHAQTLHAQRSTALRMMELLTEFNVEYKQEYLFDCID